MEVTMQAKVFRTAIACTVVSMLGGAVAARQLTPPGQNATQATRCGTADMRGSYGFVRTGVNAQGAIAAVGIGHFDDEGGMITAQTTSRNGTITQGSFPGRYEVAADCSGAWYDASGGLIAHFVLVDGGSEFFFLSTSAGNTITGHGKRITRSSR
jgi:hypothetical protein